MKYSEGFFGNSELVLRFPNILAFVLYMIYAFRLLKKFVPALLPAFFILFIANPYLLDFFALARGYGLSFAFMLMGIYHLCIYFPSKNKRDLALFNFAALMAVLSNFTMLSFYLSALATFNLIFLIRKMQGEEQQNIFKANIIHFVSVIISILVLFEPVRRLFKKNMLDFGGKNGFVSDTVGSIVSDFFYRDEISVNIIHLIGYTAAFIILVIFVGVLLKMWSKNVVFFKTQSHLATVNLVLMMICLMSILQHILLKNDFIMGRFALFLYPLFILNLAFFFGQLSLKYKPSYFVVAALIIAMLSCQNLFRHLHTGYCKDWEYDQQTKQAMLDLEKENPEGKLKTLGINWLFEPTTNFYRYTRNMGWLLKTNRDGLSGKYDYYYIFEQDLSQVRDYDIIKIYPRTKTLLLKRKTD